MSESSRAIALLDINPATDGHTLVIPRAHADDIWDLRDEDATAVWNLGRGVAHRLKEVLAPDGLTLFQANRQAGWQDVFHFHMHLVPRWKSDGLTRPWSTAMASSDEASLDRMLNRLAKR